MVVYILGLFIPWLNGNGAFWTILLGLVAGIPLFVTKEVFDLWDQAGLPDIHYTVMSSIMMAAAIAIHFVISAATRAPTKEGVDDLVWSGAETRAIFSKLERPIWIDRTLWAGLLTVCTAGFVIWFW